MVFNVNTGSLHKYSWLAGRLRCAYFQSSELRDFWRHLILGTPLSGTPDMVLPPPVELEDYFAIAPRNAPGTPRIGRLAGYVPLPGDAVSFYRGLADRLPEAEFWFMPAPDEIKAAFGEHPRFHLFESNAMPTTDFLASVDIFCLPVRPNWDFLQGPRVLSEAMAAGLPCVTVKRWGPRDRVEHGVTGFVTNDESVMADHVALLACDADLRRRMGQAARKAAEEWRIEAWAEAIRSHASTEGGTSGADGGRITP
jgi:glycosyltransferase involved in cell wall biosynthesis